MEDGKPKAYKRGDIVTFRLNKKLQYSDKVLELISGNDRNMIIKALDLYCKYENQIKQFEIEALAKKQLSDEEFLEINKQKPKRKYTKRKNQDETNQNNELEKKDDSSLKSEETMSNENIEEFSISQEEIKVDIKVEEEVFEKNVEVDKIKEIDEGNSDLIFKVKDESKEENKTITASRWNEEEEIFYNASNEIFGISDNGSKKKKNSGLFRAFSSIKK